MDFSMAQPSTSSADNKDGFPVTKEYIEDALKNHKDYNDTFKVKDISSEKALSYGDNCVAEVFRVHVKGEMKQDDKVVEVSKSVIVKIPFRDDKNTPPEMFKYECNVYNKFLVISEDEFGQDLPVIRCIKAEEHVVVTEDFKDKDYALSKRREGLNQEQAAKVIKSIAMFHAASIVLLKSNEIRFRKLCLHTQDQVYSESNATICKKTLADSYAVAKYFADQYLPKANEEEAAVIKKFFNLTSDDMYKQAKKASEETPDFAKVFVHGDCWANNFMFNSEEHALLINLATVCLTSPARDLVYLFATNPQPVNKKSLVELYVTELHKHLKLKEIPNDVIEQFSVEFIESEIKRLQMVALLTAMWLLIPISYTSYPSVDEYNKLDRKSKAELVEKHIDSEFYVRRLMEILLENLS